MEGDQCPAPPPPIRSPGVPPVLLPDRPDSWGHSAPCYQQLSPFICQLRLELRGPPRGVASPPARDQRAGRARGRKPSSLCG